MNQRFTFSGWSAGVTVFAVLLSACASASAGGPNLLAGEPPAGRSCRLAPGPSPFPSAAQIIEPARLDRALGGSAGVLASAEDYLTVVVAVDSAGGTDTVQVEQTTLSERVREEAAAKLVPLIRRQPPSEHGWAVLMRLQAGSPVRASVGPIEECPPELANKQEVSRLLSDGYSQLINSRIVPDAKRPVLVEMVVGVDGNVEQTAPKSLTQIRAIDSLAINIARQMKFRPLLINRRPARVKVSMPINFVVQEPNPKPDPTISLPGTRPPGARPRL